MHYQQPRYAPAPKSSPAPAILSILVAVALAVGGWFTYQYKLKGQGTPVAGGRFSLSTKGFCRVTTAGPSGPNANLTIRISAPNAEDLMRVQGVAAKARVTTASGPMDVRVEPTSIGPIVGLSKGGPTRSASLRFRLASGDVGSASSFEGELLMDAGPVLRFTFSRGELTPGTVKRQGSMAVTVQKVQTTGSRLDVQFGYEVPVPRQFGERGGDTDPFTALLRPADAELTDEEGKVHPPISSGGGGGFGRVGGQATQMSARAAFGFDTTSIRGVKSVTLKMVDKSDRIERVPFKIDAGWLASPPG